MQYFYEFNKEKMEEFKFCFICKNSLNEKEQFLGFHLHCQVEVQKKILKIGEQLNTNFGFKEVNLINYDPRIRGVKMFTGPDKYNIGSCLMILF